VANRRDLELVSLDRVMPEVELLLGGHSVTGNWTLGQICHHLATTMRYTVEGWPDRAPWVVRRTIGPVVARRMFGQGKMLEGIKLSEKMKLIPPPALDDRAEAEGLRAAISYYISSSNLFEEHPFFGPLSREKWDRLHCMHCAHHLSFAWPAAHDAR
jgi:hypothetical protein